MAIYIDSSNYAEIEKATWMGFVHGITTNPTILKQNIDTPEKVLEKLAKYAVKEVYYQVKSTNLDTMQKEMEQAAEILGHKLVVKIPPTQMGFKFASRISGNHATCITAIFSPSQAIIAREIGVTYVAVYINRATNILGDGIQLAQQLVSVLNRSNTKILAASIKSTEELISTAQTGIENFTLPYKVLSKLSEHPTSLAAVKDFELNGSHLATQE